VAQINRGRYTADIEGDFVVFLIGARINRQLRALTSLRDLNGNAMRKMLDYLVEHPEKGLLGYQMLGLSNVQYWRSFEHLERFARDKDDPHLDVWRNYWKRVGKSDRTGIWHETYLVRAGEYECIYGNMPTFGLAKASHAVPVAEAKGARERVRSGAAQTG
jgi:hypothetical protein